MTKLSNEILVVTARESAIPQLNNYSQVRVVNDIFPAKGSLGGVYTGLSLSKADHSLVVAGDMPFLNISLLRFLVSLAGDSGADVVIPKMKNAILEPLHAVYSKKCLSLMERLLKEDRLSILELFPLVNVRFVEEDEINRLDPQHLSFFNINTEADLRKSIELAGKEGFCE